MDLTTTGLTATPCGWCSGNGAHIYHHGACPRVVEIEYWPDGTVKRVRFAEAR